MKIRILPLLGFLFALTIFSRAYALSSGALGETTSNATAENSTNENHATRQAKPHTKVREGEISANSQNTAASVQAQCITGDVLIAANTRLLRLGQREAEIAQKETAFLAIETRLNKQLTAINSAKASLDASIETRTALAQADIAHLTLMYQTMKPKQAAKIFNEMDVNFAAGFLRKMKGSQAGLILSNMNAKKAYQISLIIASKGAKYRQVGSNYP